MECDIQGKMTSTKPEYNTYSILLEWIQDTRILFSENVQDERLAKSLILKMCFEALKLC